MSGLEIVVRPVVFPNIRPAPARVLPPPNDPTQGFCTLSGSGGKLIELSHTFSSSFSSSAPMKEVKRQVDKQRVYQKDENGKINKKNFVDVEKLKKLQLDAPHEEVDGGTIGGSQGPLNLQFDNGPIPENVAVLEADVTRYSNG